MNCGIKRRDEHKGVYKLYKRRFREWWAAGEEREEEREREKTNGEFFIKPLAALRETIVNKLTFDKPHIDAGKEGSVVTSFSQTRISPRITSSRVNICYRINAAEMNSGARNYIFVLKIRTASGIRFTKKRRSVWIYKNRGESLYKNRHSLCIATWLIRWTKHRV